MSKCREAFERRLIATESGCLEWSGACAPNGYGHLYFNGRVCLAHRVAAYLAGMLPDMRPQYSQAERRLVLHKCDNRKCCNPDHLFIGNQKDNMGDAKIKGRSKVPAPRVRFNEAAVYEMAKLRRDGVSITRVAEQFDTTTGTITKIFKTRGEKFDRIIPPVEVTHLGKKQTLTAWCKELGISYRTAFDRYSKGYKPEFVLSKENLSGRRILKEQEQCE